MRHRTVPAIIALVALTEIRPEYGYLLDGGGI